MKIEYLLFNGIVIAGPLLLLLSKTTWVIKPNPRALLFAVSVSAFFFILWDQFATGYFWLFNPHYITGFLVGNIPLEEVLFFITVPISCTFLWVNFKSKIKNTHVSPVLLAGIVMSLSIIFYFSLFTSKIYTATVCAALCGTILLDLVVRTRLWTTKTFVIFIFALVNACTFIFNLYLTARPVVIYNTLTKTNIMILTIPFEDFLYGMSLIALTIILYEAYSTFCKRE